MKRSNVTNTQACIIQIEAEIKVIIKESKKDISEMSEKDLMILCDMLENHKEWIKYLRHDNENIIAAVVVEMTECFAEYMKDLNEMVTGFEGYSDKQIFDGAYIIEKFMYDIIEAYFLGKATREKINSYWNEGYTRYFIELSRRVRKIGLNIEASEWVLDVCAKSRKYLAYLEHHKYTNKAFYEVAKTFWNEFEKENYCSYEQSIIEFKKDIEELEDDIVSVGQK